MLATAVPRNGHEAPDTIGAAGTTVYAEPPATAQAPATEPLPTAWCHAILTALEQRGANDREAGHLGILLSTLIEMQLAPADFDHLLARYAADPRPGIAAAAGSLQRAWARAIHGAASGPLPLQDQLRTLGSLLDDARAHAAYLSVGPAGASIQGCGPTPYQRTLGMLELHHENASRSALRGHGPAANLVAHDRFETRLRIVGALLEPQPEETYKLFVGPHYVEVERSDGSCQVFTPSEIAQGLGVVRQ
jgi:hypothetical protein